MSNRLDRLSLCVEPRISFLIRLPELRRAKVWRRIRVGAERRSLRAQRSGAYHRRRKSLRRCAIREVYDASLRGSTKPSCRATQRSATINHQKSGSPIASQCGWRAPSKIAITAFAASRHISVCVKRRATVALSRRSFGDSILFRMLADDDL